MYNSELIGMAKQAREQARAKYSEFRGFPLTTQNLALIIQNSSLILS